MLAKVTSGCVVGLDGYRVDVEVDLSLGLPGFSIVGLPDTAVQESKERVRAALTNCEFALPVRRVTVNLAPGDIRKEGPCFDLPIAIGVLKAADASLAKASDEYLIVGELSLDGEVKSVNGVLPLAVAAQKMGLKGMLLPKCNAREAAVVAGLRVIGVANLIDAVSFLSGEIEIEPAPATSLARAGTGVAVGDFSEVKGQEHAKRALEIAAAGGHNMLMVGPPGSGKSMLARRLPGILPGMELSEAVDVTRIYSVAGLLKGEPLVALRPFRAPHHTISTAGLVGGGHHPRPGEVSLSHQGVLFLDEFAEFGKHVLQVLRQPMEEGSVTISRASGVLTYPSKFMLVAAMNPCPCGYYGDRFKECVCHTSRVRSYQGRVSGPIVDRIDLHVEVARLRKDELTAKAAGESSESIRARVERAREIQNQRALAGGTALNSQLGGADLERYCRLGEPTVEFLSSAIDKLCLSARGYDRVLRVARTIADLAGEPDITTPHVAEAVSYRSLERSMVW